MGFSALPEWGFIFVFYYFINISVTSKDFEEATALKKSIEMLGQTKKRLV